MHGLLSVMGIALVLLGCGIGRVGVDRGEAVADLERLMPTLVEYRVTKLYRSEECESLAYERGVFVSDPDSLWCDGDAPGGVRIDDRARADLDAIYAESEQLGDRIQAAVVEYGPDGKVTGGYFEFVGDGSTSYVYEPGWTALPSNTADVVTAMNADWYELSYEASD